MEMTAIPLDCNKDKIIKFKFFWLIWAKKVLSKPSATMTC